MTPFSGPLPLRTTAAWSAYRVADSIAHRYGETSGELLQYSPDRRVFVWADHGCQAIDDVLVGGQSVSNWVFRNAPDSTGRTVCFVEFATSMDEGVSPIARGRGKLNARTGSLIVNPADVVHDILANIAGRSVTPGQLDVFRRSCERAGLEVAGSVESGTVQAACRAVCASVGAVFAPDATGLAFLHPTGPTPTVSETIDSRFPGLTCSTSVADLINDLTLKFDFEDGEPRQSVQMEVSESVKKHGRRSATVNAAWLISARVATSVASRMLQRSARPVWRCSVGGIKGVLSLGDGVALSHARLPITGTFPVLARSVDFSTSTSAVEFEVPSGALPSVRLIRLSSIIDPEQSTGATVRTEGGSRVINITGDDGLPAPGVQVTLNGQTTRTTDSAGNVRFPVDLMPSGQHTLTAVAPDGRTSTIAVQVP